MTEPLRRAEEVFLVRHGQTAWSASGQRTGVTDLPQTPEGRAAAKRLAPRLAGTDFALVLTSPLVRARSTCELAGLGGRMQDDPDLAEWNYRAYEGLTPEEIHRTAPGMDDIHRRLSQRREPAGLRRWAVRRGRVHGARERNDS